MLRHLLCATALLSFAPDAMAQRTQARAVQSISAADRQAGAQAHPQLLKEFGGAMTGPQASYVEQVGRRVAVQSDLSNARTDFTITLLNSPVENAFAIPGGYVYVTRQLLGLMNSEAELASVLGHEVGHVAARHSASRNRTATIGGVLAAVVGTAAGNSTAGQLAGRAAQSAAQLYTLRYGREQEYDADRLGVRYIHGAGYDPFAAADMLASLDQSTNLQGQVRGGQQTRLPTWASSHPNGPDRVRRAAQLAQATGRPMTDPPQDTAFLRRLDGLPYDAASTGRRIRIRTVRAGETIDTFARQMAYPDFQRERFTVLNALEDDQPLRAGMLVKVVTTS